MEDKNEKNRVRFLIFLARLFTYIWIDWTMCRPVSEITSPPLGPAPDTAGERAYSVASGGDYFKMLMMCAGIIF